MTGAYRPCIFRDGLFGLEPDLPRNRITIEPRLPSHWKHASIRTPDVNYTYTSQRDAITLQVTTPRPIAKVVRVPAKQEVISVMVMLLADWQEQIVLSGKPFNVPLLISRHETKPLAREITWRIMAGDREWAQGKLPVKVSGFGTSPAGEIDATLPDIESPTKFVLEAGLRNDLRNSWDFWCFPQVQNEPDAFAVCSTLKAGLLESANCSPRLGTCVPLEICVLLAIFW